MGNSGENVASVDEARKGIDWKQGLIIAMGIPILIVPSLCDLSMDLWAMSIAVWVLSVLSGFLVNLPLGEMCAAFDVPGVGGAIQYVFADDEKYEDKKINRGRLLGSFGAWAYFATWVPVIPIFTISTGVYIANYLNQGWSGWQATAFYLVLSVLMVLGCLTVEKEIQTFGFPSNWRKHQFLSSRWASFRARVLPNFALECAR